MEIVFAIVFGTLFGFVLHRVGAADPDKIIGMLQLKDFHLMKTILLAIGLSSILLYAGLTLGWIPHSHLSIKGMYSGVIAGGAVLGAGWAIAGYCPGTGIVALGCGRKDAIFFVLGGLVGAALFMGQYQSLAAGTGLFNSMLGGKVALASPGLKGLIIAGAIGLLLIGMAWALPDKKHCPE